MKTIKSVLPKAGMIFLIFTLLCGVIYTGVVTGIAQLIFPDNANGSIIEVDGKKYGCELLGQQYTDEAHMWGRIMNIDVSTYTDENGKALMYAAPSNLSPASEEYAQLVAELPVWYAINLSDPEEFEAKTKSFFELPEELQQKITAIVVDGAGYGGGQSFDWQKQLNIDRQAGISPEENLSWQEGYMPEMLPKESGCLTRISWM